MELYKIVATCENDSTTLEFNHIPENFEGVKISQKFSFINPIGYTPKFSISTYRAIKSDKVFIDSKFSDNGLQAVVKLGIYKLKPDASGYDLYSIFAVDFESFKKFETYSEFPLKSISVIDYYNSIKNTEIQVPLTEQVFLPNTQKYINYISLKSIFNTKPLTLSGYVISFDENNKSKFFDKDSSLTQKYIDGYIDKANILTIGQSETSTINVSYSGSIEVDIDFGYVSTIEIAIYRGSNFSDKVLTLLSDIVRYNAFEDNRFFEILPTENSFSDYFNSGNTFFIGVKFGNISNINSIKENIFIDLKKTTSINVVTENDSILAVNVNDIFSEIFSGNSYTTNFDVRLTSSNHLVGIEDKITFKPSEFLSDIALVMGLVVNFTLDGNVTINFIDSFFNHFLSEENAIEVTNFKDFSLKYSTDLNFSSVSVGQEQNDYDIYTYMIDWFKKLTFAQSGRNATENLDLTLKKYRTDFSGILDYYYKKSQQKNNSKNENFIFKDLTKRVVATTPNLDLYDYFTPRDILNRWIKFLSFCFQNFNFDTLVNSSNGGSTDDLIINSEHQLGNLVLNETPRLLPIEINFTCLLESIDFSEKILKITEKGEIFYIFVIEATSTDTLSEQKIRGLKIEL